MTPILGMAKVATRILAFVGRELAETARRPGAMASLVLGPFLIMALFGLGYGGYRRPLPTVLVVPSSAGLPTDVETYREVGVLGLDVVDVVPDVASADRRLQDGSVDVVAIAPGDTRQAFLEGRQSEIEVHVDVSDPLAAAQAGLLATQFSDAVNREIIRRAVEESESEGTTRGLSAAGRIPPEVVASPTRAVVRNLAPVVPSVVGYFGPTVLVLILQHLAVTLIALSVVRERTSGLIELFQVAPVSASEVVAGKVLGFGAMAAMIAIPSVILLTHLLDVPMLGSGASLAMVLGLVVLASLGLGLLISIVSGSERQAVQLSLLVLLASVFFSGFVLPLSEFTFPVQVAAHLLPATSGIQLTQQVMLRGEIATPWVAGLLALLALVLLLACWLLLRRGMRRA